MYLNNTVKIPDSTKGITRKIIKGVTYIYYAYSRTYDAEKKYTVPKCTSIGKCVAGEPNLMYPNANYFKYFPDAELPTEAEPAERSSCLRIGAFLIIRKIIADYNLDKMLGDIIGSEAGLFLDIAAYTIICENNAGQYYPDYAFNHPLLTNCMKVYSDSTVSKFINSISRDQIIAFQDMLNATRDHREKIYISYDSTNKNCQAGDIEMVEYGHPKDNQGKPILNIAIAYDRTNSEPLFYEEYCGSIVDVSQLQQMLEKAKGYGYNHIGFILDRGYFSEANIHYMDKNGYEFVIMMKGMKSLVKQLVLSVKGTFENSRKNSIRAHKVSGITVKKQLFPSDAKERYFHIFYSDRKKTSERENVENRIDRLAAFLKDHENKPIRPDGAFKKYFDITYFHEGKPDEKFLTGAEKYDVIDEEISLCGYFVIITSEEMTASEAINLYKGRDASEKLFRGDKSYLGSKSMRAYSTESIRSKLFIEFVALMIRNKMHTLLKKRMVEVDKKYNYFTVPAAIRELEKIEMIKLPNGNYCLDHAVTATQKELLKAFNMNEAMIKTHVAELNKILQIGGK